MDQRSMGLPGTRAVDSLEYGQVERAGESERQAGRFESDSGAVERQKNGRGPPVRHLGRVGCYALWVHLISLHGGIAWQKSDCRKASRWKTRCAVLNARSRPKTSSRK